MQAVLGVGAVQREGGDFHLQAAAALHLHLVEPAHEATGGLQRRAGGVFEALAGAEVKARGETFRLRFHLHPGVQASPARDGGSVLLALPDRTVWRFTARGATLGIEDSVHLAAENGLRRTRQIVLEAPVTENGARIAWSLKLQPATRPAPRRARRTEGAPQLPLEA
ncbi:MAG TPA: hypothetical protein ENK13_04045 [Thermopetrobacter sp.]|nr:hypothetical protein [Thermopetrobacter sp.]